MGRRGGYGKTGSFSIDMELNVWYSVRDVCAFFKHKRQNVTSLQAKSIMDALHKAKWYKTDKKVGDYGIMVMLLERTRCKKGGLKIPAELMQATISIEDHCIELASCKDWTNVSKQKTLKFKKNDPLIMDIVQASQESRLLQIAKTMYLLKACADAPRNYVKVVFVKASKELLNEMRTPPFVVKLS